LLHQLAIPSVSWQQVAFHTVKQHESEIIEISLQVLFVGVNHGVFKVC
jgi:hypothetical protein